MPRLLSFATCRVLAVLLLASCALAACATSERRAPDSPPPGIDPAALRAQRVLLERAYKEVRARAFAAADVDFQTALNATSFDSLASLERHDAIAAAAVVASRLADVERTRSLSVRASEMNESTVDDWHLRLWAAGTRGDAVDATLSVVTLSKRWPLVLAGFNEFEINRCYRAVRKASDDTRLQFLQALYRAEWRMPDGLAPSAYWRDLALLYLKRDNRHDSLEVAFQVTDPRVLISMRADYRFDGIVLRGGSHFDVAAAGERRSADLEALLVKRPGSSAVRDALLSALLDLRHYERALQVADEGLSHLATPDTGGNPAAFDYPGWQGFLMERRAVALRGLDRWSEAEKQWQQAIQQPEAGHPNVSQRLNLGMLYCELGQPAEAMRTIAEVKDVNPHGRMELEHVRLEAALELGDTAIADDALSYLRAHPEDAPQAVMISLLRANHLDEALKVLQGRLDDPDTRAETLELVQQYQPGPATPQRLEWDAGWNAWLQRPQILAAIARVGRVERYTILR